MLSGLEEGPGSISGQVQGATHGGELGVQGEILSWGVPVSDMVLS